jgi:simple sugar transport system permease protein
MRSRDADRAGWTHGRASASRLRDAGAANVVPLLFLVLCVVGIALARLPLPYLLSEIVTRFGRNSFLILSLILPIVAGLGLNFGIVIGAMAGQIGAILVTAWGVRGIPGLGLALALATPLSILFGWLVGNLFNRAKGREMVTGMIAAFFANGVYQAVFLLLVGRVIPLHAPDMILPQGFGLRNTIDLAGIQYALDGLIPIEFRLGTWLVRIPLANILLTGILCLGIVWFLRTKIGQELRALGQDDHVSSIAGIAVARNRTLATILSTVLAAWGQLIFLQNIGTLNTYNSHEQVGMFAIASLLVSGATVSRATVGQAILGTILFHTLFTVSPIAGQRIAGDAQIGEFFRVFIAYGIITVALALHAWQSVRARRRRRAAAAAARAFPSS